MELGKEVYDKFMDKHPKLNLNLHVCRIYRDARRLHGQGPGDVLFVVPFRQQGGGLAFFAGVVLALDGEAAIFVEPP